MALYVRMCGRNPDFYRRTTDSKRWVFDWEGECFVEGNAGRQGGGVGMGMGVAATGLQVGRLVWGGYAGYLRGTVVMD